MGTKTAADFDPVLLARPNIIELTPYSSARDEYSSSANVFLDANENSLGSPTRERYNRYPDPRQTRLKQKIAGLENVPAERIFIGNGSDEPIDLLFRVFCRPGIDNCVICPPTYGMYAVSAAINDVEVRKAPLTREFELDTASVIGKSDAGTKLVFICSPNNPTGNSMDTGSVIELADSLNALIVVDEAYIHFSSQRSIAGEIAERPNIVVLRTFSKAWGLAGLRIGTAFADLRIVELLNKVKPPYNVSDAAQNEALEAIRNESAVRAMVESLIVLRAALKTGLEDLALTERVFPSDANFLLVKMARPRDVYEHLIARGIVVRDRSRVELCEGCLRITVGTEAENRELLSALAEYTEETE